MNYTILISNGLLETFSQDSEDSGLSTDISLLSRWRCSEELCHWKVLSRLCPEVLPAADILTSRASQSVPVTTKSGFQDKNPFLSRKGNVPKITKPREAWHNHVLNPNSKIEGPGSPRLKYRDKYWTN